MRQLTIFAPTEREQALLAAFDDLDPINLVRRRVEDGAGEAQTEVSVSLNNESVGRLLDRLREVEGAHVTFDPRGALALGPPLTEASEQVKDVTLRSPYEIYLAGQQSVGSWRGFVAYAAMAGMVTWMGLVQGTSYLLVGAMLIAPFAGPAMNAAVATAAGDARLLGRSVGRYAVGVLVLIAMTALLTLVLGPQGPTNRLLEIDTISQTAALLPLVAGVAGGFNLIQSERDSLVPGAAVGVLVAASLAPPAGMVGIAVVLERWDMVTRGGFILLLQLVGINLVAAAVFRWVGGLGRHNTRLYRSRAAVSWGAWAVSALAVAGLLYWQLSGGHNLERDTVARQAGEALERELSLPAPAQVVDASARFLGPDRAMDMVAEVQISTPSAGASEALKAQAIDAALRLINARWPEVKPHVQVTVLTPAPR